MLNYNEIERALTNGTTEEKIISPEIFKRQSAYQVVLDNCQTVKGRRFCAIPVELLEIDEDYQRVYCINMQKVYSLVKKWDANKCEPILVSPHPETATFAVIDGSHRMLAAGILKEKTVLAMIAENLSEDPSERKMQEAKLFSDQGIDNDRLIPSHKHKAYVTQGIKKHCVLNECIKGRKLLLSAQELKNMAPEKAEALKAQDYKVLSGYNEAVRAAAMTNGKEILTSIFNIIQDSGWHTDTNGYSKDVISTLRSVLNMHNNDQKVIDAIVDYFKYIKPNTFFANAHAKYENRRETEKFAMYLEEQVAKRTGEAPLYTGGDLRRVTSAINSHRRYGATGTEN